MIGRAIDTVKKIITRNSNEFLIDNNTDLSSHATPLDNTLCNNLYQDDGSVYKDEDDEDDVMKLKSKILPKSDSLPSSPYANIKTRNAIRDISCQREPTNITLWSQSKESQSSNIRLTSALKSVDDCSEEEKQRNNSSSDTDVLQARKNSNLNSYEVNDLNQMERFIPDKCFEGFVNFDERSNDSQSSFYSSPELIIDLCGPKPETIKTIKSCENQDLPHQEDLDKMQTLQEAHKDNSSNIISNFFEGISNTNDIDMTANTAINASNSFPLRGSQNFRHHGEPFANSTEFSNSPLPPIFFIYGQKSKRKFPIKSYSLIRLVQNRKHALHKWANIITKENIQRLPPPDRNNFLKLLAKLVEVKV